MNNHRAKLRRGFVSNMPIPANIFLVNSAMLRFFRLLPGLVCSACLSSLLLLSAPLHAEPITNPDGVCVIADPDPPEYYQIHLVPTGRVPGTRLLRGIGAVTFETSPFGISISPEGSYIYKLDITVDNLKPPSNGVYAVWVSTPDIQQIKHIGVLDDQMQTKGTVDWNKFLVIITLEPSADTLGDSWTGPVVFRGLSRSGMMHTMAGHGPYQQEPCATYGYN